MSHKETLIRRRIGYLPILLFLACTVRADIPALMGSGNFTNGAATSVELSQYKALNWASTRACRFNAYPDYYYLNSAALPANFDAAMQQAQIKGVTPIILFEHYGNDTRPVGDYSKWYAIGWQFANRFRPNSPWWIQQGKPNFGVTIYEAFNEPDALRLTDTNSAHWIDYTLYHEALRGLADGVHAVDPTLKVIPGGFMAANAFNNYTLAGYGTAIADLLNDGTHLDGIDLHTYYHSVFAPLIGTYQNSAQHDFDAVKTACGITRDISHYCTEHNYNRRISDGPPPTYEAESTTANRLLTGIWDVLGVVKNDGTSATKVALGWNFFNTNVADDRYGICTQLDPWLPTARGKVYQMVGKLTQEMDFVSLDPKGTGVYVLSATGKKMWVWQRRPFWSSNATSTTFTASNIPSGVTRMEVYGWNGLRKAFPLSGQTIYPVTGLSSDETYMLLATSRSSLSRVNCGGGIVGSFVADVGFTGGSTDSTTAAIDLSGATVSPGTPAPATAYQSRRFGQMTYTINSSMVSGLAGGKAYILRLHFAEITKTAAGQRIFNVSVNGDQSLTNFDIFAEAGAKNKALVKEFLITANNNNQIVVNFTGGTVASPPMISAIEILQAQ